MNTIEKSTLKVMSVIPPAAAKTADAAGLVIDTAGYETLTFAIHAGVVTDGLFTAKIEYADAITGTIGTDAALVSPVVLPANERIGDLPTFDANTDVTVGTVGAVVKHRYYQLTLVETTASAGAFLSANAILGGSRRLPTS